MIQHTVTLSLSIMSDMPENKVCTEEPYIRNIKILTKNIQSDTENL